MTICSSSSDMSDRYNNLKAAWDSLMEAAEHASPQGFRVAVTVVLEHLKRDELKRKTSSQRNEDTFASSCKPSASYRPSFVILGSCPVNRRTCKNACDAKKFFVPRAIHFSIGHSFFVEIFVLKAASSQMPAISVSLTLGTAINYQLQY
jgi:hypothetical protein